MFQLRCFKCHKYAKVFEYVLSNRSAVVALSMSEPKQEELLPLVVSGYSVPWGTACSSDGPLFQNPNNPKNVPLGRQAVTHQCVKELMSSSAVCVIAVAL